MCYCVDDNFHHFHDLSLGESSKFSSGQPWLHPLLLADASQLQFYLRINIVQEEEENGLVTSLPDILTLPLLLPSSWERFCCPQFEKGRRARRGKGREVKKEGVQGLSFKPLHPFLNHSPPLLSVGVTVRLWNACFWDTHTGNPIPSAGMLRGWSYWVLSLFWADV